MYKFLLVLVLCSLVPFFGTAQSDAALPQYDQAQLDIKEISEEDLTAYKEDSKFDYEIKKNENSWWNRFTSWIYYLLSQFFEWLFGAEKAMGFLAVFLRVVPYVLLGVLIFLLIKFFLKVNSRALIYSKKNTPVVSLSEEEHIIKHEDIEELIQKALADKDYRLAIRYYYLFILKLMSDKKLIAWELQKTNKDYLNELKTKELQLPFTATTRLYDHIWYGRFALDEIKYQKAQRAFSALHKTLREDV